jgi:transcriptional regulator with XRE-family HTH domain
MNNELGQWIERERKKRGWSQRRLAHEAGISQAPISRIINKVPSYPNEQICGEKVAQALARAFGANPIYVFRLARILKPPTRSHSFSAWLVEEMSDRGITQNDLVKTTNLDPEIVSDLTQGVPPAFEVADALADGLQLERLYVQQLAGLVPPGEHALSTEEIDLLNNYRELSKSGRKVAQDVVNSLVKNME